ncbi:hypothetical protein ACFL34_01655 [Candidatus Sumerlaeota bacterium]
MKELSKGQNLHVASAKAGMCEKTARKYRDALRLPSELKVEHAWRTRKDALGLEWSDKRFPSCSVFYVAGTQDLYGIAG